MAAAVMEAVSAIAAAEAEYELEMNQQEEERKAYAHSLEVAALDYEHFQQNVWNSSSSSTITTIYESDKYKTTRSNTTVTIQKDTRERRKDIEKKNDCITLALEKIEEDGYKLPNKMRFWLCSNSNAPTEAFPFDHNGKPMAEIVLSQNLFTDNINSNSKTNKHDKMFGNRLIGTRKLLDTPTKIIIYEIGHILHAHNVGVVDWYRHRKLNNREVGFPRCALDEKKWMKERNIDYGSSSGAFVVSSSSAAAAVDDNRFLGLSIEKMFVAQVFLGLMIGRRYNDEIMTSYDDLNGPSWPAHHHQKEMLESKRTISTDSAMTTEEDEGGTNNDEQSTTSLDYEYHVVEEKATTDQNQFSKLDRGESFGLSPLKPKRPLRRQPSKGISPTTLSNRNKNSVTDVLAEF